MNHPATLAHFLGDNALGLCLQVREHVKSVRGIKFTYHGVTGLLATKYST